MNKIIIIIVPPTECSKALHILMGLKLTTILLSIITLNLQMRTLRHRDVKWLAQGHTDKKYWGQASDPGHLSHGSELQTTALHWLWV